MMSQVSRLGAASRVARDMELGCVGRMFSILSNISGYQLEGSRVETAASRGAGGL